MKDIQDLVKEAKASGHKVQKTTIDGITFIYSNFLRSEWTEFQKLLAAKATAAATADSSGIGVKESGEDLIVEHKTIVPTPTKDFIASLPAGTITLLADLILKASGFGQAEPAIELL
jgi:hypothetical protein